MALFPTPKLVYLDTLKPLQVPFFVPFSATAYVHSVWRAFLVFRVQTP